MHAPWWESSSSRHQEEAGRYDAVDVRVVVRDRAQRTGHLELVKKGEEVAAAQRDNHVGSLRSRDDLKPRHARKPSSAVAAAFDGHRSTARPFWSSRLSSFRQSNGGIRTISMNYPIAEPRGRVLAPQARTRVLKLGGPAACRRTQTDSAGSALTP
jgi:hypothetical protein